MADANILLVLSEPDVAAFFDRTVFAPAQIQPTWVQAWKAAETLLHQTPVDLVILGETVAGENSLLRAETLMRSHPATPFCLILQPGGPLSPLQALRQGFFDCWQLPLQPDEVLNGVQRALSQRRNLLSFAGNYRPGDAEPAQAHLVEILDRTGRIIASLDFDHMLAAVVEAAVDLTGAEEGSLLLLDEATGEYRMRASHNFQQEFAQNYSLPVHDPLLSEVVNTGRPYIIDQTTPRKIKTAYLVHALIYMPLKVEDSVIGALEVDHRQRGKTFTSEHIQLLGRLSAYAAAAIENARQYARSEAERKKLEAILSGIEEAMIVVDYDSRILFVNSEARAAFGIKAGRVQGLRAHEVLAHGDLLDLLSDPGVENPTRVEISLEDGRVLNAQVTPLPELGVVISMQDITHLKELDRIKSDFVHTVSHDLRSPLTAILGYVELIDRVGPVTAQQREFIHRVQVSVQNITALINDLLDLGRIEAGFDARKEITPLRPIIQYSIDGMLPRFNERTQELIVSVPEDLPHVLGNPVRLRQMFNNLLVNANKYTPPGGGVQVIARSEGGQIILQISDNGTGIPPADQPYIFDKFYRAGNISADTPGTGLGLAIVKSIVENHLGRIWVDSVVGKGTTFTIVMPALDKGF